jgi:hypothetical protein
MKIFNKNLFYLYINFIFNTIVYVYINIKIDLNLDQFYF